MAYSKESFWCALWIIIVSVINERRATTMTGKIAHKVELCPKSTKDWLRASKRLNCTNDFSNPVNRYHCLPADDLSTLVEFCYKETRPRVSKGSCMLYVQNISYLNGYNCSGFSEGCPNNMYFSDESYQFPRCVEINSKRRCFVAESSCRETTKTNQTSHSTSTVTSKRNDDVLAWSIFSAVFLLVVIVIVVICISKRRVCHERMKKKRDTDLTQIPGVSNETDPFLPSEWRLRESPEKCSDISISNVDDVTHISFVTSEFMWLDNKQWAMKIDHKGNILSKLVLGDIWGSASSTVDENGDLLIISQHNKVMKVKANEEEPIEMLTVDYNLSIFSVYYARSRREILIRIYSQDGSEYWTKIVRYNENVKKISEFEYRKHEKSIVYPLFLSENTNRDICIADNYDGHVRAFNEENGNLRQRYSYEGRSPLYDFSPTGICNDLLGHVLVCNCHKSNPSVHLLDIDGKLLSKIIDGKRDVIDPWGLCAYKGKLYLGQKSCNVIKVFSYLEKIDH